jgi:hypothetical protein
LSIEQRSPSGTRASDSSKQPLKAITSLQEDKTNYLTNQSINKLQLWEMNQKQHEVNHMTFIERQDQEFTPR